MGDCTVEEKINGDQVVITCRVTKSIIDRVENLRATRRPIPTKIDMLREVLLAGLETLEKK